MDYFSFLNLVTLIVNLIKNLSAMSKSKKKKSLQEMNKIKDPDAEEIAYLKKDIESEKSNKQEVQWNNDELERRSAKAKSMEHFSDRNNCIDTPLVS